MDCNDIYCLRSTLFVKPLVKNFIHLYPIPPVQKLFHPVCNISKQIVTTVFFYHWKEMNTFQSAIMLFDTNFDLLFILKLRHVYTNKYIHVSTTETSIVDKSKMMVSLKPHNSKQAMFKILPMCKVKVEGEKVRVTVL